MLKCVRENTPENRVLTLEEVVHIAREGEPAYVEVRSRSLDNPGITAWGVLHTLPYNAYIDVFLANRHVQLNLDEYRKTWRCWLCPFNAQQWLHDLWEESSCPDTAIQP